MRLKPGDDVLYTKTGKPRMWRKKSSLEERLFHNYAPQIGWLMLDWNTLHASFFRMFWTLLDERDSRPNLSNELWHSNPNDDTQRKMLLALASHKLRNKPAALKALKWAIATVEKMVVFRNIAVHVPVAPSAWRSGKIRPRGPVADVVAARFSSFARHTIAVTQNKRFWPTISEDLYVLDQYVNHVWAHILVEGEPLPNRPRLPSLSMIQEVNDQVRHLLEPPKRKRQRRASKGKAEDGRPKGNSNNATSTG